MKLERCPLCRSDAKLMGLDGQSACCSKLRCEFHFYWMRPRTWNRVAGLIRDGREFRWLVGFQRSLANTKGAAPDSPCDNMAKRLLNYITLARKWWRGEREKKR